MLKLKDAQCCWGAWHLWMGLPGTQTLRDTAVHSECWAGASGDAGGRPRALEQRTVISGSEMCGKNGARVCQAWIHIPP